MKKMILGFLLGIIVTGTTVFALNINSNEVSYGNGTVKDALDNVYSNLDAKMVLNTFGSPLYATTRGTPSTTTKTELTLSKGKYIVLWNSSISWNTTTVDTSSDGEYITDMPLTCESNNCIINTLSGYYNTQSATQKLGDYYTRTTVTVRGLYVEIKENTDKISISASAGTSYNTGNQILAIQAIPIN